MKTLNITKISIIVFFAFAVNLFANTPIGSISEMIGQGEAVSINGKSRTLSIGSPVYLNDTIKTTINNKIEILFIDGSTVSQGENGTLLIDAYMYNPKSRPENTARFKFIKGVFRVITDQITKLNPDRFTVETNSGNIGIRGCDLGFLVGEKTEAVYVFALHHADSVVVEQTANAGALKRKGKTTSTVIRKGDTAVYLSLDDGLGSYPITQEEAAMFESLTVVNQTKASKKAAKKAKAKSTEKEEKKKAAADKKKSTKSDAKLLDATEPQITTPIGNADFLKDSLQATPRVDENISADETEPEAAAPVINTPRNTPRDLTPSPVKEEPKIDVEPGETFPQVGSRKFSNKGGGKDWSWGVWSTETVDLVDGNEESSFFLETKVSGDKLTGSKFQDIANGSTLYDLTGSGDAAAAVTQDGKSRLLEGSSAIDVRVGKSINPSWGGDFSLQSKDGDSLSFNVNNGTINSNGKLGGNMSNYSLNAFGESKGSPSSKSISGNLVGPGTGSKPITGAIGTFDANHSDGTTVDGVFGSDLD